MTDVQTKDFIKMFLDPNLKLEEREHNAFMARLFINGTVFSCFMASFLLGSTIFSQLGQRNMPTEVSMSAMLIVLILVSSDFAGRRLVLCHFVQLICFLNHILKSVRQMGAYVNFTIFIL